MQYRKIFPLLALLMLPLTGCGGGGGNCDGYTYNGGCVVSATPTKSGPILSSLSVATGPAAGGTTLTITGSHFTDGSGTAPSVLFVASVNSPGQTIKSVTPTNVSNTSLTVVTPPGTGTVDVIVSGIVYSPLTTADHFQYQ